MKVKFGPVGTWLWADATGADLPDEWPFIWSWFEFILLIAILGAVAALIGALFL